MELIRDNWQGTITTVKIGATKEEGGTRQKVITIGGERHISFLQENQTSISIPVIAWEVWDIYPQDWPEQLKKYYKDALDDPLKWLHKITHEYQADLVCYRLVGCHPDQGKRTLQETVRVLKELLQNFPIPFIITGCDDDPTDNLILPACSQVTKNERCLIGPVTQDNYKTIVASLIADGHNVIAQSPIDINIAKQLNILISDMGMETERIVMDPTSGALGYGLEYSYSIMERARLAALSGDKLLACPFICFVGQEAGKAKEAKTNPEQGILWETLTATTSLLAGADILVMRHPLAIAQTQEMIRKLTAKN